MSDLRTEKEKQLDEDYNKRFYEENKHRLIEGLIEMKKLMITNAGLLEFHHESLGHHVELFGAANITQSWIDGIKDL